MSIYRCNVAGLAYSVKNKAIVNRQGIIHICLLDKVVILKSEITTLESKLNQVGIVNH